MHHGLVIQITAGGAAIAFTALAPWCARFEKQVQAEVGQALIAGRSGERRVAAALRRDPNCLIIDDITLPLPNGHTCQLDHIVAGTWCLWLLETKNWRGIVRCSAEERWQIRRGTRTTSLGNPLRQNLIHAQALAERMNVPCTPLVVMAGSATPEGGVWPDGVVSLSDLPAWLAATASPSPAMADALEQLRAWKISRAHATLSRRHSRTMQVHNGIRGTQWLCYALAFASLAGVIAVALAGW